MAAPVVVVGDSLLDIDLCGRAGRLCPDAPVPVLDELDERPRPGGAALAAAVAAAQGREVVLVTAIAADAAGERLAGLVRGAGVTLCALPQPGTTPVKQRVRSGGQSLLRLDEGTARPASALTDEAVAAISAGGAVLVSDYGQGLTGLTALRELLGSLPSRTPLVWDPHPRGSAPVPGARLVTPNESEAAGFAPDLPSAPGLAGLSARAAHLVRHWQAHSVAVTLGSAGALLSHGESSPSLIPAPRVRATDTCGAGDAFSAGAVTALADGAVTGEAVQAAVLAAAAFVEAGGAAAWSPPAAPTDGPGDAPAGGPVDAVERVRASGGTVVATGGCFDLLHAGHVATLEAARGLGDCLVVCLNSDASVARLKGPSRPLVPAADRARVLEALAPVDQVVVFDEDTPEQVLRRLRPDVWVKGGDYAGAELPESAVLREWDGQAVVVPYLPGHSTTGLLSDVVDRAGATG